MKAENNRFVTGIPRLDAMIDKIRSGSLVLVQGRHRSGKTAFCRSIFLANNGKIEIPVNRLLLGFNDFVSLHQDSDKSWFAPDVVLDLRNIRKIKQICVDLGTTIVLSYPTFTASQMYSSQISESYSMMRFADYCFGVADPERRIYVIKARYGNNGGSVPVKLNTHRKVIVEEREDG